MPADAHRHAVLTRAEVTDFRQCIQRTDVEFDSLRKLPGQGVWQYPKLYKLFRQLRPHIVHSHNPAALEVLIPVCITLPADPQAMAQPLVALAGSPWQARRKSQTGRQRVLANFSMKAMVSSYQRVYDQQLKRLPPDTYRTTF